MEAVYTIPAAPFAEAGAIYEQHRKSRQLSQETTAHLCGVTRNTYASWERGLSDPSRAHFLKLCFVLGIDPREFASTIGYALAGPFLASRVGPGARSPNTFVVVGEPNNPPSGGAVRPLRGSDEMSTSTDVADLLSRLHHRGPLLQRCALGGSQGRDPQTRSRPAALGGVGRRQAPVPARDGRMGRALGGGCLSADARAMVDRPARGLHPRSAYRGADGVQGRVVLGAGRAAAGMWWR